MTTWKVQHAIANGVPADQEGKWLVFFQDEQHCAQAMEDVIEDTIWNEEDPESLFHLQCRGAKRSEECLVVYCNRSYDKPYIDKIGKRISSFEPVHYVVTALTQHDL